MTGLAAVLDRIVRLLETRGKRFALVGGIAVSVRVEPRFTRDVDLVVAIASDADAEALVKDLVGEGLKALAVVEHDVQKRLATVRLASGGAERGVVTDLLFASSGIEPEIVAEAEALEVFAGVVVPVARVGHLIALKLLARDEVRRPQDSIDLRALLGVADAAEIARAEVAVDLITARGFHRGRELRRALADARR
jgi:hypothetical protein